MRVYQEQWAAPLHNGQYCRMHDPFLAEEVAKARQVGGYRRRREKTIKKIYNWDGTVSLEEIRRILTIVTTDALGQNDVVARSRTLIQACQVALKVWEMEDKAGRRPDRETAGVRQPISLPLAHVQ